VGEALTGAIRLEAAPHRRSVHGGNRVVFAAAMMRDGHGQLGRVQIAVGVELTAAKLHLLLYAMGRRHHDAREQHRA